MSFAIIFCSFVRKTVYCANCFIIECHVAAIILEQSYQTTIDLLSEPDKENFINFNLLISV